MFTDKLKRKWYVNITLGDIRRVRNATGIDLNLLLKDPNVFTETLLDPEKMGALLWILCEKQAEEQKVDVDSFCDGFDGPTLQAAFENVVGAVADFCQLPTIAGETKSRIAKIIHRADQMGAKELSKKLDTALAEL